MDNKTHEMASRMERTNERNRTKQQDRYTSHRSLGEGAMKSTIQEPITVPREQGRSTNRN